MKEAAKLAVNIGFKKENIFVLDNGSVLEFGQNSPKVLSKKVDTSYVFIDGLGIGDVGQVVLRDRQAMAKDGMFVIIVTLDSKNGKILSSPDIISRGFIYLKENKEMLGAVRKKIRSIVESEKARPMNIPYLKDAIRDDVGKFLFQKTERRPMVLPVIIEV